MRPAWRKQSPQKVKNTRKMFSSIALCCSVDHCLMPASAIRAFLAVSCHGAKADGDQCDGRLQAVPGLAVLLLMVSDLHPICSGCRSRDGKRGRSLPVSGGPEGLSQCYTTPHGIGAL